jgi:hypothetical protein
MRLPLAVSMALCALVAAPAALAAPSAPTYPINGGYKGRTTQNLLTTLRIANKHVDSFETSAQRFCSDGTMSWVHVSSTALAGQPDAALLRGRNGSWKLNMTITAAGGSTTQVRATVRKGWLTGTAVFSDLAGLPVGPSNADVPTQAPGPGATCSTQQNATSNEVAFKIHWG